MPEMARVYVRGGHEEEPPSSVADATRPGLGGAGPWAEAARLPSFHRNAMKSQDFGGAPHPAQPTKYRYRPAAGSFGECLAVQRQLVESPVGEGVAIEPIVRGRIRFVGHGLACQI